MAEHVLHCWESPPVDAEIREATCMLLRHHLGPHVFTPDDQITIGIAPRPPRKQKKASK